MHFIIGFLFIFSTPLWAKTYSITGNEKTKTHYIERLLFKCEEEQTTLKKLEQCLLNSRLFSEVNIKEVDQKIIVDVKDRWSIIPFPSIKLKSDGKKSYGFFIFDGNFLGMGTLFGVGGSYSNTSSSYVLFYQDKSFLLTNWTMGFSTGRNNADIYLKTKALKVKDAFHEKTSHTTFSLGYSFSNQLNIEGSLMERFSTYEIIDNYTLLQEFRSTIAKIKATWKNEEYKFYFSDGIRLTSSFDKEIYRTDESSKTRSFNFNFIAGKETFNKQAIQWTINTTVVNANDKRDSLKSSSGKQSSARGLRGIPEGSYLASSLFTTSFDYQIPLRFTKYGTWTFAPFFDFGKINIFEHKTVDLWQKAYGLGSYFFLKGIMLPGIGFIVGRNETFNTGFAELSIGESF